MLRYLIVHFLIITTSAKLNKNAYVMLERNQEICERLNLNPYFEVDMLVDATWRIIHTWKLKMANKCVDTTFRNATKEIVKRIFNDMYEYLETQPYWGGATLLMCTGYSKHEMLLFADQGPAGRFVGVPNVMRDGSIIPTKKSVPLFKVTLKLFFNGKYLILSDCLLGVTTLSIRRDYIPSRKEVSAIISELQLGDGVPSCVKDKRFYVITYE